jgi:hypothetical protein
VNTPPLLLAAATLFWGWQTGYWLAALPLAALLEAPRILRPRWNLDTAEFNRVSDFCTVLLAGVALYLYFTFGNPQAITLLFLWLPVILAPLALAQAWSTSREIDLSVLFWSLRRNPMRRPVKLSPGYPYFAIWLLAASAANVRTDAFYAGLALLCAWPLALARPRSYAPPLAAAMLMAAVLIGYGGQLGLNRLQQWLESAAPEWLSGGGARTNPYHSVTDIGSIGELKLSDRIVMRVEVETKTDTEADAKPGAPVRPPILLHRASYDDYAGGNWIARNGAFAPLVPFGNATTWRLGDTQTLPLRLTVHDQSEGGNPVLALPSGAQRIEGLAAGEVKANALGAVQAERRPGYFSYRVLAAPDIAAYGAPSAHDLHIAKAEAAAVGDIAARLRLTALPPAQALAAISRFFAEGFTYSTWQGRVPGAQSPLAGFLLATHAGHCEHFASATVLLARAAGIPARYATGFSVQETGRFDHGYVVRERHAHAWARVWVDGAWRDLDTTPPSWFASEGGNASAWSPVADLWSSVRFRLAQWSAASGERGTSQALIWLLVPLLGWLAWRTLSGRRADPAAGAGGAAAKDAWPGMDSEFYLVERRLAELGRGREATESLSAWLAGLDAQAAAGLAPLARLHSRYRFDPAGLPEPERGNLRAMALAWLERHPAPGNTVADGT